MLAVTLGIVVAAAPAAFATPDVTVALPMTTFRDILVDTAHGHVFLTGGGSTGVVVRNLDGSAATVITNEPGASMLALSPDGSTLYVGLEAGDGISAIDTTTLTETTRYATGASTCPYSVAAIGTSVWFGYGCSAPSNIGVVDLSVDPPVVSLNKRGTAYFYSSPSLVAAGDHLIANGRGSSPSDLYSYPVSGTTLGTPASRQIDGYANDMAVTSDNTGVVVAEGYPYYHPRFKVSDLSADGAYGTSNPYPNAVAIAGDFVAAGINASYDKDIRVYTGAGAMIRDYELGQELYANGLAFTSDQSTLFAVGGAYSSTVSLHVLHDPTKLTSTLTLTAPSAHINTAYTINGTLTSSTAIPAGAVVHVTRQSPYDSKALPDVTTNASGAFSVTNTVGRRGNYTYTFTYDGDSTHGAVTKAVVVKVIGITPSMSITTNASTYAYHATASITAHLGATHTNRTLRISATPYASTAKILKTGTVDSSGNLKTAYWMSRRTTFSSYFAGDDTYEPRTITRTVVVRVAMSETMQGYYTTSGSYKVYHSSANPTLYAGVTPNRAGTCVAFTAQRYYSGAWHTVATASCYTLDSTSHVGGVLYGTHTTGMPYRMQATFAGDSYNAKTVAAWVYFKFTT